MDIVRDRQEWRHLISTSLSPGWRASKKKKKKKACGLHGSHYRRHSPTPRTRHPMQMLQQCSKRSSGSGWVSGRPACRAVTRNRRKWVCIVQGWKKCSSEELIEAAWSQFRSAPKLTDSFGWNQNLPRNYLSKTKPGRNWTFYKFWRQNRNWNLVDL